MIDALKEEAASFTEPFSSEWTDKVSSQSHQILKERKYKQTDILPLTSDLLKLKEKLNKELDVALAKLKQDPTPEN